MTTLKFLKKNLNFIILKFMKILNLFEIFKILNFKTIFFLFNFRILKIGKPRPERVLNFPDRQIQAQRVLILGINTRC